MDGNTVTVANPLLDLYYDMLAHQREHNRGDGMFDRYAEPHFFCHACLKQGDAPDDDLSRVMRLRYAWAIPTPEAIDTVVRHSPNGLVEIGAGTGYWARLLADAGCDVVAYDVNPPGGGPRYDGDEAWHAKSEAFHPVAYGMSTSVQRHADRTLLLCWPCYDDPMAYHTLRQYEGDTLVYIGEGPGGCTADDRFHKLIGGTPCWHTDDDGNEVDSDPTCEACKLDIEWVEVESVALPQWQGLHDRLHVYKRCDR